MSSYPLQALHHDNRISANHLERIKSGQNVTFNYIYSPEKRKKKQFFFAASTFAIRTTMPMVFLVPSLQSSTVSSMTTFMNGSKPRRMPVTLRPPFNFSVMRLSMNLAERQNLLAKVFAIVGPFCVRVACRGFVEASPHQHNLKNASTKI